MQSKIDYKNLWKEDKRRGDPAIKYPGERYFPRERVWKILEHQEADRVPAELGGCLSFMMKQAYFKVKHYLHLPTYFFEIDYWPNGASYNSWWNPPIDEKIYRRFRIDFRPVSLAYKLPFIPKKFFSDKSFIDNFGFHRKASKTYLEFSNPATLEFREEKDEILNDPSWSDPEKDFTAKGLGKKAKKLDDANFAVCAVNLAGGGVFENSWLRRGFNKFMEDMYLRPTIAEAIMDKVTEQQIQFYNMLLDEVGDYATLVGAGDDLGAQTTVIVNPSIYKKFLKPRQKKIFDTIHKKTSAKLYLHSCGNVEPFISDLIEIGVDVLNPVQPECPDMDLSSLKEKYGDELTFCGGIGSQNILPQGSVFDVEAEVKRALKVGAEEGGYIVAPGHIIQPDVSPENVCALYDSVLKHGFYPINS